MPDRKPLTLNIGTVQVRLDMAGYYAAAEAIHRQGGVSEKAAVQQVDVKKFMKLITPRGATVENAKLDPPDWLDGAGCAKWRELIQKIPDFDPDDADTLALLCASWASLLMAIKAVAEQGQTLTGDKGREFINPAVNIINEERKSILKLSKLLGIGPTGTARAKKDGPSKFTGLLDG